MRESQIYLLQAYVNVLENALTLKIYGHVLQLQHFEMYIDTTFTDLWKEFLYRQK